MELKQAKREKVKLKIGISGISGSGKTYSALLMAYGITNDWNKIAIIDCENGSSNLYAHLGSFRVLSLTEPYSPERYIEAIKACENASVEVIIIDSASNLWSGQGGILQMHKQLGGKFQHWAKLSIIYQGFIDTILKSNCHIITTVRSKIGYSMDAGINGKTKVVKLGLKPIIREGLDFEMTLFFELINDNHLAKVTKNRTGLFLQSEFVITKGTGKKLRLWSNGGESFEKAKVEIDNCTTLEGLRHLYGKYVNIQKQLYPIIVKRKQEIEAVTHQVIAKEKIVEPLKQDNNGINNQS